MSEQANLQANVELIQAVYAAYGRGDIQSMLESLSANVEWIAAPVEPVAGTYRGRDEVAHFFRKVSDLTDFASFEPREYVAQGDRVLVLGHYRGTMKSTGRIFDCEWAMAFTVQDGKITQFQEFTDTGAVSAALTAASAATA
jgi:ketosteroid isomerase-like protein